MIDIKGISQILPHRYPFLLTDRVLEIEEGKRAVGYKNVSITDPYLVGHFPDEPIMPGVLILEAMAQVGGFMFLNRLDPDNTPPQRGYIAGFDKVKFLKFVIPGDCLMIEAELVQQLGQLSKAKAVAKVDSKPVVKAEITYIFRETPLQYSKEEK